MEEGKAEGGGGKGGGLWSLPPPGAQACIQVSLFLRPGDGLLWHFPRRPSWWPAGHVLRSLRPPGVGTGSSRGGTAHKLQALGTLGSLRSSSLPVPPALRPPHPLPLVLVVCPLLAHVTVPAGPPGFSPCGLLHRVAPHNQGALGAGVLPTTALGAGCWPGRRWGVSS